MKSSVVYSSLVSAQGGSRLPGRSGLRHMSTTRASQLAVRNLAMNVRCDISGYLPIHAATVSSRTDVFDYLIDHCG
eukprot:1366748-Prymnesium_polylepis.2